VRKTKINKITDLILSEITSGKLRGGDRVYSERAITRRFKVSLGTAQRALKELQELGVVVREHGRGSFIKGTENTNFDARYIRFKDVNGGSVLPLHAKILSVRRTRLTDFHKSFFGSPSGHYVRIIRQIDVGGKFDLLSEFYLAEENFMDLKQRADINSKANIRELLASSLSLPTLKVEQRIRFDVIPSRIAHILGAKLSNKGFYMEMRAYTLGDRPLYLQCVFGGDISVAALIIER
jgi:DNA-binding GntR family transcriptional regulator